VRLRLNNIPLNECLNKKCSLLIIPFLLLSCRVVRNHNNLAENIYCEIRCCNGSSPFDKSLVFSEEGLLCKNPDFNGSNNRTYFIDYLQLNQTTVSDFQYYLKRNNFFNYDSVYNCIEFVVIDGFQNVIIFNYEDTYKKIIIENCTMSNFDSIYYYMNSLIPDRKKDYYEIRPQVNFTQECQCINWK